MKARYACQSSSHGVARRDFLGALGGASALAGVSAIPMLQSKAFAAEVAAKKKSVLTVFLSGGVSQLETWDPKPGTLNGGPFRAIPTSVPGVHICELLPLTAKHMNRMALIRSINTAESDHGRSRYRIERGHKQSPTADFPHLGALVAKTTEPENSALPGHIHVSSGGGSRGSNAAYLGPKYSSIAVGTNGGLRNSQLPGGMTATLNDYRQSFRRMANEQFMQRRRTAETDAYLESFEQAEQLMRQRDIFDVSKEPEKLLETYGNHDLGKQCLLARRLIEHGISYVQVSHSNYDTHAENFNFHIEQLGEFDQAFSALMMDLHERELLDSTLVLVLSEFGRTPIINSRYGRDHWGRGFSIAMAGCGLQHGAVIGAMSDDGTQIKDREVNQADLFHTYLEALGVDPNAEFDIGGRKIPIADPTGESISELLA